MSSNTMRSVMAWDLSPLQRFVHNIFPVIFKSAHREAGTIARDAGLGIAQLVVHKDTWSLHNSGRRVPIFLDGIGNEVFAFRFGGYITNPKTGRKVDYAHIHEDYLKQTEGRGYVEAGVKEMGVKYKQVFKTLFAARKISMRMGVR